MKHSRKLKNFLAAQNRVIDKNPSPALSVNKAKKRYFSLRKRLNDSEDDISFSDAEIWVNLILPIPAGRDQEVFRLDKIMTAMQQLAFCNVSDCQSQEEIENAYIDKLDEVAGDPYEMVRWQLIAGSLDCCSPRQIQGFAQRLGMEDVSAAENIIEKIRKLALEGRIDYPIACFIGEENDIETEETVFAPFLYHVRERVLKEHTRISFEDARNILQSFIDCTDEQEIRNYISLGIRSYEDDVWTQYEAFKDKEELADIMQELDDCVNEACEQVLEDPVQATRWMLLGVAHLCRNNENEMDALIAHIGADYNDAQTFLAIIEAVAENDQIIPSDEEQISEKPEKEPPVSQCGPMIEYFIGNHLAEKPKQWNEGARHQDFKNYPGFYLN